MQYKTKMFNVNREAESVDTWRYGVSYIMIYARVRSKFRSSYIKRSHERGCDALK